MHDKLTTYMTPNYASIGIMGQAGDEKDIVRMITKKTSGGLGDALGLDLAPPWPLASVPWVVAAATQ